MANYDKNIISEIAENIDCGFDCYYNLKTNKIVSIPSFSQFSDEEDFKEAFSESLEIVEDHKTDFIKFEALESFESFRFIDQISDPQFKSELENILQNRKPFQNFKNSIDNSDFRQKWFDFRKL